MGSTLIVDEIQGASTAANVKLPAGCVVQTVNADTNTYTVLGTTTTFTTIGLEATITPKYNNSKIIITTSINTNAGGPNDSAGGGGGIRVVKKIGSGSFASFQEWGNDSTGPYNLYGTDGHFRSFVSLQLVDTASSLSALTYRIEGRAYQSGNRFTFHETQNAVGSQLSTMMLTEIAQ